MVSAELINDICAILYCQSDRSEPVFNTERSKADFEKRSICSYLRKDDVTVEVKEEEGGRGDCRQEN